MYRDHNANVTIGYGTKIHMGEEIDKVKEKLYFCDHTKDFRKQQCFQKHSS